MDTVPKKNTEKTLREKIGETMNEVITTGRDAFLKTPEGHTIHLAFDMVEANGRAFPVCNIFRLDESGNIDMVLYEKTEIDGKIMTTGSLEAVYRQCRQYDPGR